MFQKRFQNLIEIVNNFIEGPLDYDLLLKSFKKILYHGQTELADKIIENKYEEVKNSANLLQGAEFDLAIIKYYIELERFHASIVNNSQAIDWNIFKQQIALYDFKFEDDYLKAIELGINSETPNKLIEELTKDYPKDRTNIIATFEILFLKRMSNKKIEFPISGLIWYNIYEYWESRIKRKWSWPNYFKFNYKDFSDFLNNKSGFFLDYRFEQALILWGSSYVIDFLYDIEILDQANYESQKEIITNLKNAFTSDNEESLWEYNFVHDWLPAEKISPKDQIKEEELFTNSFDIIPEEMKFDEFQLPTPIQHDKSSKETYRPPRKIGRNEKVSVKYRDGTVKKEIKYKKVIKDLEEGKCELL